MAGVGIGEFLPYIEATAMGLGVGLERDWNNRGGEQQAAGSRTFAVVGLAGAIAAAQSETVVAAGALGLSAVLTAGYVRTANQDKGITTEVAALVTFLLGALAYRDAGLAIGLAVVMVTMLAAKGPIHRFAREVITGTEVEDALRFFVVAFVVLPLLPDRKIGPYGVLNPSKIWLLVVALTGIGWVGYIAVRSLGSRRGLLITGFAGGFISATATTGSLAHLARKEPARHEAALGGALLASAATFLELGLITWIANPELLVQLMPALAAGLVTIAIETALLYRRAAKAPPSEAAPDDTVGRSRPFAFWPALALAGILTTVLLAARWGADVFGSGGTVAATGLAGFADVHAAVLAVATLTAGGSVSMHTALVGSGLALAANTAVKFAVGFAVGGRNFGTRFASLLAAPTVAVAAAMLMTLQ